MTYSQFNEDGYIAGIIKDQNLTVPKTVLDIGAYDGVTHSNSRLFIEQGWEALLVEGDLSNFDKLQRLYSGCKNVTCVNEIVTKNGEKVTLKQTANPMQKHIIDGNEKSKTIRRIMADAGWINKPVGVCSIDIEGCDTAILIDLLKIVKPVFIIIESHTQAARKTQLEVTLTDYHLINVLDFNVVFIKREAAKWIPLL